MKRWNVVVLRRALQRGVRDPATDPERLILLPVAGAAGLDAGLKTEPAGGGGDLPRRAIRRCRMKGVHLERNKPLQAPETADGTTAPAVAAPLASGFAAYGGLAQMFTPPPPIFGPGKPGVGHDHIPASCAAPTAGVSSAHDSAAHVQPVLPVR